MSQPHSHSTSAHARRQALRADTPGPRARMSGWATRKQNTVLNGGAAGCQLQTPPQRCLPGFQRRAQSQRLLPCLVGRMSWEQPWSRVRRGNSLQKQRDLIHENKQNPKPYRKTPKQVSGPHCGSCHSEFSEASLFPSPC